MGLPSQAVGSGTKVLDAGAEVDAPAGRARDMRLRRRWRGTVRFASLASLLAACSASDVEPPVPDPFVVRVLGAEYEWRIRYAGADGEFDTSDDVQGSRDLHVPVGANVEVALDSADYIYRFRVPDLGVNEMAVPEIPFTARFVSDAVGTHELLGDQMCGLQHESLIGRVVVHSRAGYRDWLEEAAR